MKEETLYNLKNIDKAALFIEYDDACLKKWFKDTIAPFPCDVSKLYTLEVNNVRLSYNDEYDSYDIFVPLHCVERGYWKNKLRKEVEEANRFLVHDIIREALERKILKYDEEKGLLGDRKLKAWLYRRRRYVC